MPRNEFIFGIPAGTDGDTFGGDDSAANNPDNDRTLTGQVLFFAAHFSSFHRYLTPQLLPGSFITKARFSTLVANDFETDRVDGIGFRRLGIMLYDGLWNVTGFSVANYPLRSDLPRPTERASNDIIPGRLFQDEFFGGFLQVDEATWTGLTVHTFGDGYEDVESELGMVDQLMDFINDPGYDFQIGITMDGFFVNPFLDDLRIGGSNIGIPMGLHIEWFDPVTPSSVTGVATSQHAVSGTLTWEPAVTGVATSQPAVSGQIEVLP